MKTTTKVIEIKQAPTMKNPAMVNGVRDLAAAKAWGERNGYPTVYYLKRVQRVYAERLTVRVDEQAQKIEQASSQLAMFAEACDVTA